MVLGWWWCKNIGDYHRWWVIRRRIIIIIMYGSFRAGSIPSSIPNNSYASPGGAHYSLNHNLNGVMSTPTHINAHAAGQNSPMIGSSSPHVPGNGASPALTSPASSQWNAWSSGICDCCADFESMTLSCLLPCVQFGLNKEKLHGVSCYASCLLTSILSLIPFFGCCLVPLYTHNARLTLRDKYGIREGRCLNDCGVHFFCLCCALSQEARELTARGVSRLMPAVPSVAPVHAVHYLRSNQHQHLTPSAPLLPGHEQQRWWHPSSHNDAMPVINTPSMQDVSHSRGAPSTPN